MMSELAVRHQIETNKYWGRIRYLIFKSRKVIGLGTSYGSMHIISNTFATRKPNCNYERLPQTRRISKLIITQNRRVYHD